MAKTKAKSRPVNAGAIALRLERRLAALPPMVVRDAAAWQQLKDNELAVGAKSLIGLAERWARLLQAAGETDQSVRSCLREANYGTQPDDDREDRLYELLMQHWDHMAFKAVIKWRYSTAA